MRTLRFFLLGFVAAFLVGCATPKAPMAKCEGVAVCPIEISRSLFSGVAKPEFIYVAPDTTKILLWKFASTDFYFNANPADKSKPDRVELIGVPNSALVGITPCFATDSPTGAYPPQSSGKYFRCAVRGQAPEFTVQYRAFFSGYNGSRWRLDPTITNSRDPSDTSAVVLAPPPVAQVAIAPATVPVATAHLTISGSTASVSPETLPVPLPSSGDQTHVIWDLPAGAVFDTTLVTGKVPDGIDFGSAVGPVCFAVDDASSMVDSVSGSLYKCIIFSNANIFPADYTIQFRDAFKTVFVAKGTLTRP